MISKWSNITTVTKLHRLSQQNEHNYFTFFLGLLTTLSLDLSGVVFTLWSRLIVLSCFLISLYFFPVLECKSVEDNSYCQKAFLKPRGVILLSLLWFRDFRSVGRVKKWSLQRLG